MSNRGSKVMKKLIKNSLIPVLVLLVIGFAAFELNARFVTPIKEKGKNLERDINLIKSDKIIAQEIINNLSKKKEELALYNSKIPDTPSLPEIIEIIDNLAKSNSLKWESGTPAPQKVFDETLPQGVSSWSIGSTFIGDYVNIYNFINSLTNLERMVTIESFTLQREQGSFRLNISLRFYAEEIVQ